MKGLMTLVPASLTLATAPALAVDGVREINQSCAENTGCFTGDTAGFPVTITVPGSYRLTGNLHVADVNTHAIQVSQIEVTLDLNGHEVTGPVGCSGVPVVCGSSGSGRGVTVDSDNEYRLAVRNGTVSGFGNAGVFVGQYGVVEDLRVAGNAGDGIRTSSISRVARCSVNGNAGRGITATSNTIVEDNFVNATGAGNAGIEGGSGMVVRLNHVTSTGDDGIRTLGRELVSGNSVRASTGDGIQAETEARIEGNLLAGNTGFGLRFVGVGSGYAGNLISSNTAGTITGAAGNLNLGGNVCNAVLCP